MLLLLKHAVQNPHSATVTEALNHAANQLEIVSQAIRLKFSLGFQLHIHTHFSYAQNMRLIGLFSYFLLIVVTVDCVEKARYDNYRVYNILIENNVQVELMREIENYPDGVELSS